LKNYKVVVSWDQITQGEDIYEVEAENATQAGILFNKEGRKVGQNTIGIDKVAQIVSITVLEEEK